MNIGYLVGIGGAVIGLLGGVLGTYASIRNTHGPRERAFMIRAAVACWVAVLAFIALLLLLPGPYRWLVLILYVPSLVVGTVVTNRWQQRIRQDEATTPKS